MEAFFKKNFTTNASLHQRLLTKCVIHIKL